MKFGAHVGALKYNVDVLSKSMTVQPYITASRDLRRENDDINYLEGTYQVATLVAAAKDCIIIINNTIINWIGLQ